MALEVWYGSLALFTSILHNVFLLYHVEVFVSIYKIDKTSFWVGETIFLIWNSVNDPLFGWLSDRKFLNSKSGEPGVVFRRMSALSWNGPFFCLSFLAFWISWTNPSIQFVICLCLYDGFLTMVDLHHSALLADLAVSANARTTLNSYCSIFSAVGSLSVFISYVAWDRGGSKTTFRVFCVALTIISLVGFTVGTRMLKKYCNTRIELRAKKHDEDSQKGLLAAIVPDDVAHLPERAVLKTFVKQLLSHRNFGWFAAMNLVQVFHCHFNSNFFPLFLDHLLGDAISQTGCSVLLGISFIAPHINNLYFLTLCRRMGVYAVIRMLFFIKLILAIVMLLLGPSSIWLLAIFIASNRVFTEGTCKLLNLVISDLVDEDFVIHGRKQAVSALMFGTSALVSKPGQTLAPLLGMWLLSVQTGHDIFQSGNADGSIKLNLKEMDTVAAEAYRMGVFSLLIYIPVACAIFQLFAWSHFTLHGRRLHWVKSVRAGATSDTV
ncbi:transmembrane protein 180-like [Lineus longissimus]|uniref:transmembrane protein 180-like n=1 Tax=Lineus longissimus TaxID=88925 RepID=UPI00315D257F